MTKAQVVDGEFVMKEILFQKKEQEAGKNAEAIAAKAKTKAQNGAVVVGKGKGKAAVVGGVCKVVVTLLWNTYPRGRG